VTSRSVGDDASDADVAERHLQTTRHRATSTLDCTSRLACARQPRDKLNTAFQLADDVVCPDSDSLGVVRWFHLCFLWTSA